ncbi:MAG: TIM barrel protein [Planctomycetaceae bacterium]
MSHASISRRTVVAGLGASVAAASVGAAAAAPQQTRSAVPGEFRIAKNRIHQAVMGWCFDPMPIPDLIRHCADIGYLAMEGIDPKFYPEAKKHGLKVSLVNSHGFVKGPVDPKNHEDVIAALKKSIDIAAEWEAPNVITFTGMRVDGISDVQQEQNCIDCWKQVIDYAENKQITLVLEHLNTRDDSHPMKGHPGYFGDDVERCIRLVKQMDSERFRLLFDIYHVQIMNGDVIRRIRNYHSLIGHYHTAGNPGRGELDETQEINYPAIMHAILNTGYQGYVTQEFIPTWDDPVAGLRHAAWLCDV